MSTLTPSGLLGQSEVQDVSLQQYPITLCQRTLQLTLFTKVLRGGQEPVHLCQASQETHGRWGTKRHCTPVFCGHTAPTLF